MLTIILERSAVKKIVMIFSLILNSIHLFLHLTFEKESNVFLLFLNVLATKSEVEIIISLDKYYFCRQIRKFGTCSVDKYEKLTQNQFLIFLFSVFINRTSSSVDIVM